LVLDLAFLPARRLRAGDPPRQDGASTSKGSAVDQHDIDLSKRTTHAAIPWSTMTGTGFPAASDDDHTGQALRTKPIHEASRPSTRRWTYPKGRSSESLLSMDSSRATASKGFLRRRWAPIELASSCRCWSESAVIKIAGIVAPCSRSLRTRSSPLIPSIATSATTQSNGGALNDARYVSAEAKGSAR